MGTEAMDPNYIIYYVIAVALASFIIGFRVARKEIMRKAILWGAAGSILSHILLILLFIPMGYLGIAAVILGGLIEPLRQFPWFGAIIVSGALFFSTLILTHAIIRKLFNKI